MRRRHQHAFTLIEISIVLVMVGLIVGGVVAGQSLLRQSAMRNAISQYQKFLGGIQQFQGEFNAYPGDMMNAQDYWGTAHATPATCITTASTGTETCNGNGDRNIALSTGSNEIYRFWQHLANAGMIDGKFDGITHGSTTYSSTTANAPTGRLSGSLWSIYNWGTLSGASYLDGIYNNTLIFGGLASNDLPTGALLIPGEAWNIDTKIDDGKPGAGILLGGPWSGCTTAVSSAGTSTAAYALSTTSTPQCVLLFPQVL